MRPMTIDIDELAFALDTPGIDHYLARCAWTPR